jgi:hypothetical protein
VGGSINIFGGMKTDGTNLNGANEDGVSVLTHSTGILNTTGDNTSITIKGAQDLELSGMIVAGGSVAESGIDWSGKDSSVRIESFESIWLDASISATKDIIIKSGPSGEDNNNISLLLTKEGSLVASAQTSDRSGSLIDIHAQGDIQLMGGIIAGGSSRNDQLFWSKEDSKIMIQTDGQTWLGGEMVDALGEVVDVGGKLFSNSEIEIFAGTSDDGISVKAPGSAQIAVKDKDGTIHIEGSQDIDMKAMIVAGGEIILLMMKKAIIAD